jgi:hypothetical protein
MLLESIWSMPLHPDTPGHAHDYDLLADALRQLNAAYRQEEARNTKAGYQHRAVGEYASSAILDQDQDGTLGSRFLYAFWRLCEQQIGALQAAPPGHSAQVTAARAAVNPDVRVVALRRAGPSGRPAARAGPGRTSGITTGWCGCTRSGSGTRAYSSTRSSTAGLTLRETWPSRCSPGT